MSEPNGSAGENASAGTPNPGPPGAAPPQYYAPPGMVPPPGAMTVAQPAGLSTPQKRGLTALAIVGIVIGAVTILVVGFFVWLVVSLAIGTAQEQAKTRPPSAQDLRGATTTVHDFLAALESRDAAKACELTACDAKNSPFLGQKMLDASPRTEDARRVAGCCPDLEHHREPGQRQEVW